MRNLFAAILIFAAGIVYGEQVATAKTDNLLDFMAFHRGWDAGYANCQKGEASQSPR
jgi:hypothetical protein